MRRAQLTVLTRVRKERKGRKRIEGGKERLCRETQVLVLELERRRRVRGKEQVVL